LKKRTKKLLSICPALNQPSTAKTDEVFFASFFFRKKKTLPAPGPSMILGLGSDLCDIRRIERMLARHGERFTARLFTETERAYADRKPPRARAGTYAKRFAAKEACAKALGTGMAGGVFLSDLGVLNLPGGRPTLVLAGGAIRRLAALTPAGMEPQLDLTLTDEYPYAFAQVIISAVPHGSVPQG
jgi:holo-[acyl-carrier protein] synthase